MKKKVAKNEIRCPFCKSNQEKPIKTWKYSGANVSRYKCKCNKFFNFYLGKKNSWTIPKHSDINWSNKEKNAFHVKEDHKDK